MAHACPTAARAADYRKSSRLINAGKIHPAILRHHWGSVLSGCLNSSHPCPIQPVHYGGSISGSQGLRMWWKISGGQPGNRWSYEGRLELQHGQNAESKGCLFDCNYTRALRPSQELGGGNGTVLGFEDAMELGMMGEVESKHVSICCWDGGATKRNFHLGQLSPKPQDVVQGWAERRRWTHRNNRRGAAAACLCLPEYKLEITQIGALTKLWHRNQPASDTRCQVAKGEIF